MKRWVIIALLLIYCAPSRAAVQTVTHVTSWSIFTNNGNRQAFFELSSGGTVEVSPFAPDVVRVRFHFGSLYPREEVAIKKFIFDWPNFTQSFVQVSATNVLITTSQLQVSVVLSNQFQVHFFTTNGVAMLLDDKIEYDMTYTQIDDTNAYAQSGWSGGATSVSNLPSGFKLRATKQMGTNDAFFGLGDTAGPLNRRGRVIQFWTQDTYSFGEERTPRYTALPMLYGVRPASTSHAAIAYGLFFNNPARPVFRLDGTNGLWSFEAGDDQLDYFFFSGGRDHTMPSVIDRYSELTGRPVMLPRWGMGYHQSRHSYFTQDEVMDVATGMRSNDFPCDAIYLDIGVQKSFLGGLPGSGEGSQPGQLTFSADFTNVTTMVDAVGDLGMKLVPIIEPLLTTNDPLYSEAFTNLYFIKANDLSTYVGENFLGAISWLDFSITNTVDWWTGHLTNYLADYGFEGIWNDLNEPNENAMPLDTIWYLDARYDPTNAPGSVTDDSRKWHAINKNTYNLWEARVTYDALRLQNPAKRPFVLSRGAWPGVQAYAAGWSGDNVSSFDHLRFNTPMGLNVMMSGQAWFGHDIGGFVGDATAELLSRWMQAGALQPLFRNHTTLGSADQEPWKYGTDYVASNRRWVRFRYRMMPYLYGLAAASVTNGMPLNVPVLFHHLDDTNTYASNTYDYLVGRDLLVAPVYTSGASTREVYLPSGSVWYHWDTGRRYEGGQTITVPASLAYLPLFSRAGAIIPTGPAHDYAGQVVTQHLEILLWPGRTNSFELYEDDGESTNYLAGGYARARHTATASATNALGFTIGTRSGTYNPGVRDIYLVLHDAEPATAVTANSAQLTRRANRAELEQNSGSGWAYSWWERKLTVKVADTGTEQIIAATFEAFPAAPELVAPGTYTNLAVAGTFNYWNQRAANMRRIATNQWGYVVDLTGWTNIQFKFVGNDAWEIANWGDNNPAGTTVPLTGQTTEASGANIALDGGHSGWYTFTFNETSLTYSVVSALASDLDGDGIPDGSEAAVGLNPYAPGDSTLDPDGDDLDNRAEYIAGTSIIDAGSRVELTSILDTDLSWSAVTGRRYAVLYTTNLVLAPGWLPLLPYTNVMGVGPIIITDTSTAPFRAYRLRVDYP